MTRLTEPAQMASHLMTLEAERLQHRYLGPEHVLLALLRQTAPPPACYATTASTWRAPGPAPSG
jgi:Clp amino terminal domain, pathogenicity island component